MIPGVNLLNIAMTAIAPQSGQWLRFTGNTTNNQGQDIPAYADPVTVTGSFQSIDAETIQQMGLNVTARHRVFYTTAPIEVTDRSTSPDLLIFYGRIYQASGEIDWLKQDGWRGIVLTDDDPAP